MEQRTKFRNLRETRWASMADMLCTFRTAFRVVVQALENLAENGDAKAWGYMSFIMQFDLIIGLGAAEHVLSNTVVLFTMLQDQFANLFEAAKETKVVISALRMERGDQMASSELF